MASVVNEQSGFTRGQSDCGDTPSFKSMNNYEMLDKTATSSSTLKVTIMLLFFYT